MGFENHLLENLMFKAGENIWQRYKLSMTEDWG